MPLEKLHVAESHLKLPDFIYDELVKHHLLDKFLSHSLEDQDSAIDWIDCSRKSSIRNKRLDDLIANLKFERSSIQVTRKHKWYKNPI